MCVCVCCIAFLTHTNTALAAALLTLACALPAPRSHQHLTLAPSRADWLSWHRLGAVVGVRRLPPLVRRSSTHRRAIATCLFLQSGGNRRPFFGILASASDGC